MTQLLLLLLAGLPAPPEAALVLFLGSNELKPLAQPAAVRIARVDNFLPPASPPPDAESLHLPAIFRVRHATIDLAAVDAAVVRSTLASPLSYESYVVGCIFEPGIAFTFPSRSDLMALVCFKCGEVAFVRSKLTLKKISLTEEGKRQLWDVTTRAFPELRSAVVKGAAEQ